MSLKKDLIRDVIAMRENLWGKEKAHSIVTVIVE